MLPHQRRSLQYFLYALPVMTILMVMVFGGDDDPFAKWLHKWETLIAGILAVGAAAVTILQMQHSDVAQENRHNQLIRLSMRAETLRVLRAHKLLTPTFLNLGPSIRQAAARYWEQFRLFPGISSKAFAPFDTCLEVLTDALSTAQLRDVKALLDPDASISLLKVERYAQLLGDSSSTFRQGFVAPNNPETAKHVEQSIRTALELADRLAIDCEKFGHSLQEMALLYANARATI